MAKIKINSFEAIPNFDPQKRGGYDLFWEVETPGFTPAFLVFSSETESGPWEQLTPTPVSENLVQGVLPKRGTTLIARFFQLQILKDGVGVVATSAPTYLSGKVSKHDFLLYREMLRRQRLGLEKYRGDTDTGWLLRRKLTGEPCPCRDPILNQSVTTECLVCFGTGIKRGYWPGFQMYAEYTDSPPASGNQDQTNIGITESEKTKARLFAFPLIKYKDIWVDTGASLRYEIQRVNVIQFRGLRVSQTITISKLPIGDPAYRIPLT